MTLNVGTERDVVDFIHTWHDRERRDEPLVTHAVLDYAKLACKAQLIKRSRLLSISQRYQ